MGLDDMKRTGVQVERIMTAAEGLRIVQIDRASLQQLEVVIVRVTNDQGDDSDLLFYPTGLPASPPVITSLSDLKRDRAITSADGLRVMRIERTLPPFDEAIITVADEDAQPMGEVWIFRKAQTGRTTVRHEETPGDRIWYPSDLIAEGPPGDPGPQGAV